MVSPKQQSGYDAFGKVVLAVVLLVASTLVNGLVLTRLWAWFVASTFGVRELSVAEAIGLALTVRFLLATDATAKNDKSFSVLLAEAAVRIVLGNGFVLLLGLLVVQFT